MSRISEISSIRFLTRTMVNIANGKQSNSNELVDDRLSYFVSLLNDELEDLRAV